MSTDAVHLIPTNNTPEVHLNPNGIIKIKGRAIDENRARYSNQIMLWLDSYLLKPAKTTEVTIALEYLNSYNSIIIAGILRKLTEVRQHSKDLVVKWFIESDDEDMLERGQYISSTLNIPIDFIITD
jgi:hypothetical protein